MIPAAIATTTAKEAVQQRLYQKLHDTVADLLDSGQIDTHDALALTEHVSKALSSIPSEVGDIEVLKSIDYGAYTTDSALLTQGGALTAGGLSEYRKRRLARELYQDTLAGQSPVAKAAGYSVPEDLDDFRADIAECFIRDFGVSEDDALDCTERFFDLFAAG